jgi:hypothetical protein
MIHSQTIRKIQILLRPFIIVCMVTTVLQGCDEESTPAISAATIPTVVEERFRKLNVQYQGAISDNDIGVPVDIMHANRLTRIDVRLEINSFSDFAMSNITHANFDNKFRDFSPDNYNSYTLRSPHLKVTDSQGDDHVLVIYLIPLKSPYAARGIGSDDIFVLTTLDDISYSFITRSQSHSSFFFDRQINEYHSYLFQGQDTIQGYNSTSNSRTLGNWLGLVFDPSIDNFYNTDFNAFSPKTQTRLPCIRKLTGSTCNLDDNLELIKEQITYPLLQPLAPVSVPNVNWFELEFTSAILKSHPWGAPITEPIRLAMKNEIDQRMTETEKNVDIGWFGLPVAKREQIERLHYTQLNLSMLENAGSVSANHKINVKQIQIYEYTNVDLTEPDYTKNHNHNPIPTNLMDSLLQPTEISPEIDQGADTLTLQ